MKICVAGWFLDDDFYRVLKEINYSIIVISHNPDIEKLEEIGLPYKIIDNIGLEFGAYDYYLKNEWDRESDILFTHDDTRILDNSVFDKIADLGKQGIDQAYIFKNKAEEVNNGGKHGRAIFMSAKLLTFMISYKCNCYETTDHYDRHNPDDILLGTGPHTGFWFDPYNLGHASGKPPKGVRHYNEMIYHFHKYMGWVRDKKLGNPPMNVVNRALFEEYNCARRGQFREERERKKRK